MKFAIIGLFAIVALIGGAYLVFFPMPEAIRDVAIALNQSARTSFKDLGVNLPALNLKSDGDEENEGADEAATEEEPQKAEEKKPVRQAAKPAAKPAEPPKPVPAPAPAVEVQPMLQQEVQQPVLRVQTLDGGDLNETIVYQNDAGTRTTIVQRADGEVVNSADTQR